MPTLETLPVRVFKNLTRRCYSIQARVSGRWLTVAHASDVLISPATFKVSEAGRQRVLATGRKVVHAWVVGDLVAWAGLTVNAAAGMGLPMYGAMVASGATPADVIGLADRLTSKRAHLRYRPSLGPTFQTLERTDPAIITDDVTQAEAVWCYPGGMVSFGAF